MTALQRINKADRAEAESLFRDCCGSARWAMRMASSRPFASEIELIDTASAIWNDISTDDWLEAFSAHPKIGETKASNTRFGEWSKGEQAGMNAADELIKQELADANRAYHEKFGFIFIVCATGKSAGEMLQLCRDRFGNDRETEIGIAAEEQEKITEIRLRKLLDGST
jgi:OHCU decarboxylase